jgi:hypothetical protein
MDDGGAFAPRVTRRQGPSPTCRQAPVGAAPTPPLAALNSRAPIDAVRARLRVRELQDHSPPLPEALLALGSHPGQALSRRFVNHAIPVRLINTLSETHIVDRNSAYNSYVVDLSRWAP